LDLPGRAEILPVIESGELDHLDFDARVFQAGTNRNHYTFRDEDLDAFAASFVNRPFLRNHATYDIGARDGIILLSRHEDGAFVQKIRLTTRAGMTDFIEGRIDRFSIGWFFDKVLCSLCHTNWYRCPHSPGQEYETETGMQTCELIFTNPQGKETSAVNTNAVEGTGLLAALQDYKLEIISGETSAVIDARHAVAETPTRTETHKEVLMPTTEQNPGGQSPVAPVETVENNRLAAIEASRLAALEANRLASAQLLGEKERLDALEAQLEESNAVLVAQCEHLLTSGLSTSRLPEIVQGRLRKKFEGRAFKASELSVAIEEARLEVSALTAGSVIKGPGRVSGMVANADQLQAAVEDMFAVPRDPALAGVKPARLAGIRELYLTLTGDYDLRGGYSVEAALATTADFTGLVKNALNKVVAQQWEMMGRAGYNWWERIVQIEHFDTLNSITGVLMGTVGSLPVVAEQGEYTELSIGDSPETASFVKYGGYIPLTLELIDRDETRKLRAYPVELANAALRRISGLCAAVFTDNSGIGPTMADTGALFNATAVTTAGGHANLLTTALSASQWETVSTAVFNQPMLIKQATGFYGTGAKMGIDPRFLLVPRTLRLTGRKILYPELENAANIYSENLQRGRDGDVVVVPEWTDTTDWAAVVDPAIVPGIIVGERFGIKPEIYIAGRDTDPAVFMNDEHRIKVRMFNAILVQDFRPLHKSNV